MSYEGFVEHLCKNGHYWAVDCYDEQSAKVCKKCKEPSLWRHAVDQTNGICTLEDGSEDSSTVRFPLEVDHYLDEIVHIRVPIFKIPSKE